MKGLTTHPVFGKFSEQECSPTGVLTLVMFKRLSWQFDPIQQKMCFAEGWDKAAGKSIKTPSNWAIMASTVNIY